MTLHDPHHGLDILRLEASRDDQALNRLLVAQAAERTEAEVSRFDRDPVTELFDRRVR